MRRKWRLTSAIIIFILVAILVGLGMWGVLGGKIGIGGDIYFSSTDLEVTIQGKLYGHKKTALTEDTADELPGATWNADTAQDGIANHLDWSDLSLTFADKDVPITIKVQITNNHTEQTVVIGVANQTEVEDKNFTLEITNVGTAVKNTVAPGETIIYLIVLKVIDVTAPVDGKLDILFSLSNIN